jgi:hypothetical protein
MLLAGNEVLTLENRMEVHQTLRNGMTICITYATSESLPKELKSGNLRDKGNFSGSVHTCNPSYLRGRDQKDVIQGFPWQKENVLTS